MASETGIDLYEIQKSEEDPESTYLKFKMKGNFPGQFKTVFSQQNRLILDDKVFNMDTGDLIHEIEGSTDILEGISVGEDSILYSHEDFTWMSLHQWDGERYKTISKKRMIVTFNKIQYITNLTINRFESSQTVRFFTYGQSLFKIDVCVEDLKKSKLDTVASKNQ